MLASTLKIDRSEVLVVSGSHLSEGEDSVKTSEYKILVVDDQPVVRKTLTICLNNLGIKKVLEAENGKKAKELVAFDEFDVIFCDLNMPVEDGFEVLMFLGTMKFPGAVIIISSEEQEILASTSNLARFYDLNIIGCVEKPITFKVVQNIIEGIEALPTLKRTETQLFELPEDELVKYLEAQKIEAYFQPQVDLASRKMKGVEILARISDDQGSLIPPDSFIPTAERSPSIILDLTKNVIDKALKEISENYDSFCDLTYAFNISGKVLENNDFPNWLCRTVDKYGIPHENIICELTETAISSSPTIVDTQMFRLRIMKFKLSIDDFGTGYSSIAKLHTIPFNEIKIDKEFVFNCLTNIKSAAIVEQSIAMGKALGMSVVAEGIESIEVEEFLISKGCEIGQGYFYYRPTKSSEIINVINEFNFNSESR
ncbi:EAL domain-containing response regulator [Vibrio alginolyticus]|nr:EAL domain-containing response regulator [Vibrio alginolyticus]